MSKEQHSPIRFQLEESIWLDHHANAAEITSLELEPEVEVVEDSDLITIRGSLVLTGRFEPTEEEDDESLDLESSSLAEQLHFQPLRVEQKEIYQREHRGKIEKRFPVDVTVPIHKIDRLDDVYVQVEQFDYTVSEGHRLNVQAEVAISGIRTEAKKDLIIDKKEGEIRADRIEKVEPSFPLSFDVAAAKDELSEREDDGTDRDTYEAAEEPIVDEGARVGYPARDEEEQGDAEETRDVEEDQESVELTYEHEAEKDREFSNTEEDTDAMGDSEAERSMENDSEENVVPLFDQMVRTRFSSLPPDDEQDVSEDEEEEESREGSKTTTFLTQLMSGRDEESRDFTRLKMCIIQRNESLEEIAERYEMKARDIMRFNRLDTEQVSEGQIIYIPKS